MQKYLIETIEPHNYSETKIPSLVIATDGEYEYCEIKRYILEDMDKRPIGTKYRVYLIHDYNKLNILCQYKETAFFRHKDYIVWIPEREMLYATYYTKEIPK